MRPSDSARYGLIKDPCVPSRRGAAASSTSGRTASEIPCPIRVDRGRAGEDAHKLKETRAISRYQACFCLTRWLNRMDKTATDTKTRILDAADAVFVRRGIDGARMQDIADHAGVNKALLHYYFR